MTHRDGFPRLSARSAWRGDARHRKPCAPSTRIAPSESPGPQDLGKPPFRSRGRSGGGRIGGGAGKPRRCPASPARSLWVIINESWFLKPSSPAKNPAGPPPRQTRVALLSNGHGGRIAQLVEQLTLNQRVRGSSPRAPPITSRVWRRAFQLDFRLIRPSFQLSFGSCTRSAWRSRSWPWPRSWADRLPGWPRSAQGCGP